MRSVVSSVEDLVDQLLLGDGEIRSDRVGKCHVCDTVDDDDVTSLCMGSGTLVGS